MRPDKIFPVAVHRERHAARTGWPPAVRFLAGCGRRLRSHTGVCPCGVSPACRRQGAGMLPAVPLGPPSISAFPAVPCRLLYHLPQQRRDAAARGYDVIGRRTRVWHSRVPACRSGGCPAIHVSGLQQAPAPGRSPAARPIFRAAGSPRTRRARAVHAARRQGGGVAPLPFCTAA